MDIRKGGVGESFQVYGSCAAEVISGGLTDDAGKLCATYAADAVRLQGDSAGNLRVGPELRTVPCDRVGSYDHRVFLLIPGIEARCAPGPLLTYGGYAQQMMSPEKRSDTFMKGWLIQLKSLIMILMLHRLREPIWLWPACN